MHESGGLHILLCSHGIEDVGALEGPTDAVPGEDMSGSPL